MSVAFLLPGPLRSAAGGAGRVELDGTHATLADAFHALRRACPAVHDRIITERGEVRPHINIFVGDEEIRRSGGLRTPLPDGSVDIVVLPAVSGGGDPALGSARCT